MRPNSNMCLRKLELILPKIDYERLKGEFFEGYGDTFRQYFIKDELYLESIIEDRIVFDIKPDWVVCCEVTDLGVIPHSDQSNVALNYYIDPAGCVTTFWKTKSDAFGLAEPQLQKDGTTLENDVRSYRFEDLVPTASFIAKERDAYLLNIKQIHSATKFTKNTASRKILRWMWDNQDFETIEKSIKIIDKNCQ